MWHDIGHSLCGCVWVPVRGSLCLFWRENHTKGLCARYPTKPEKEEGRKFSEISRQDRAVRRSGQNRPVKRTDQSTEVGGRWRLRKTFQDSGLTNARKWVCIPSGFVRVSPEYTLVLAHRMHKSVTNFSLLAVEAKPIPWLFVLFLPPTRLCILCVGKEMWNTPGQRWGIQLDDYDCHE